jgi:tripartite-type tricarboxylate transporter receptor subunit TctC
MNFKPWLMVITGCMVAASICDGVWAQSVAQNRPMRIVTTDVGNSNDLLARILAEVLGPEINQPIIVENRGGAGGGIAVEKLVTAVPDGRTIMVHGTSIWLLPILRDDTPWDPFKDFAPISLISKNPAVLVVPSSIPVKSVAELIAYAKARPGQLNYASVDDGSPSHLAAELFKTMAGLSVTRVTYRGGGAAFNGLMTGEDQMMVNAIAPVMPLVKSGKMRALAVTSPSALLPDMPTIGASLPGYEWITHQVIMAPVKTPPAIVKQLNTEIVKVLSRPDVKERGMQLGTEIVGSTPEAVTAMMKTEMTRMRTVIQRNNVKLN